MKKFYIFTFGCQMNKSDSQRIKKVFEQLNCSEAKSKENADFVVINACSVRQTAIDRIWGLLREFKEIKQKKDIKLILTGCVLPDDKAKFSKKFDLIFEIKNLFELEKFLHQKLDFVTKDYFQTRPAYSNKYSAFVPIMTGCNNFCSYCAVPYVRGREVSRSIKDVLQEINELARDGYKEIQLLGQNVNSYMLQDADLFSNQNPYTHNFAALLWELNQISGIERIYFTSSHPKDMSDQVIHAMTLPKMVNYLNLALQSGDDNILKSMNRKYTVRDYFQIIKKIRKIKPNIAIGTDIIVGYPGETREKFENTLKFYQKVKFDISYNAMYSPRPGTAAAKLEDSVPQEEKKVRWHELQDVMEKIALEKNKKFIGKSVSVLIDKKEPDYCEGNSKEMKRVWIHDCQAQVGDIVEVEIKQAKEWLLTN